MHIVRMTLHDYLTRTNMRTVEFAKALGVDQSYASRIRRALVVPSPKQMREIFALTNGAVQPNDLVLIDPPFGTSKQAEAPPAHAS